MGTLSFGRAKVFYIPGREICFEDLAFEVRHLGSSSYPQRPSLRRAGLLIIPLVDSLRDSRRLGTTLKWSATTLRQVVHGMSLKVAGMSLKVNGMCMRNRTGETGHATAMDLRRLSWSPN